MATQLNEGESVIIKVNSKYFKVTRLADCSHSIIPWDSPDINGSPLPEYAYPIINEFGYRQEFNTEAATIEPIILNDTISLN